MVYKGGVGRNFFVDPDELCYWDLVEFGRKCGHDNVQGMYYLVPGMSLENDLRKIIGDEEVLQMDEIAVKYRAVEVYLLHSEVGPNLSPCEQPIQSIVSNPIQTEIGAKNLTQNTENIVENPPSKVNRRKKLTPKKGPHTKLVTPPRKSLRLQKDASTSSKEALIIPALNINYTSLKYASPTSTYTNSPSLQNLSDPPTLLNPLNPTFIEKEKQTAFPSKAPSKIDIPPDLSQKGAKLPSVKFVSTELPEIDTNFLNNYEWEDNRAESPLKWSELIGSAGESSEEDDPLYEPEYKKFCEGYEYDDDEEEDDDFEVDDETLTELEDDFSLPDIDLEVEPSQEVEQTDYIQPESDESDDELREARDRVKNCNNSILQVALQLHKEACERNLGDQPQNNQAQSSAITTYQGGGTSDYEGSDEDIDRPTRSEEELEGGNQSEKGELVQADTDFTKFRWKVGQRFTKGTEFKDAVTKYAVMQGRDVRYVISNKDKQRLGVKCVGGCPFYLYCSIHSRDATWLVKKVVNSHTCHRNMNKNR
ncbi:Biosynthetic peptidoglycan transglycosylase [Bienertia sinuspersici]